MANILIDIQLNLCSSCFIWHRENDACLTDSIMLSTVSKKVIMSIWNKTELLALYVDGRLSKNQVNQWLPQIQSLIDSDLTYRQKRFRGEP